MEQLQVDAMPWQLLAHFQTDIAEFAGEVMHQDPAGNAKHSEAVRKLESNSASALKTMFDTLEWKFRRSHSNSHHSTPCTTEIKAKPCFID